MIHNTLWATLWDNNFDSIDSFLFLNEGCDWCIPAEREREGMAQKCNVTVCFSHQASIEAGMAEAEAGAIPGFPGFPNSNIAKGSNGQKKVTKETIQAQ